MVDVVRVAERTWRLQRAADTLKSTIGVAAPRMQDPLDSHEQGLVRQMR